MNINWNDKDPIYRQLRDRILEMILEGVFLEGESLPSVRQLASEHRINPMTVSKAIQLLVDDDLIEKRRGLGMFVMEGARATLVATERDRFLLEEWPLIQDKIQRLGLSSDELLLVKGASL
ncbi:MAG: GntR family transcriptional regulator [Patiriisocius sp.]|jgi:GntR family transcriptional regulator